MVMLEIQQGTHTAPQESLKVAIKTVSMQLMSFVSFALDFDARLCYKRVTLESSGGTLLRDNCQLIGMPLIVLARQAQKNCD